MKTVLAVTCIALATTLSSQAALIAGWDFQTAPGTLAAAAPNSPLLYTASFGTGTIYLDGTNGSSLWTAATSGNQVTAFGGTAINAGDGFSTTTSGAASLALLNSSANGQFIVFSFSTIGITDPISVSYASQRTGTGFTSQAWEYSVDGGSNWVPLQTVSSIASSFAAISLDGSTAFNGLSTAFLRVTFTGASSGSGNNRLDNIQIATVPEPGTVALIGLGLGAVLFGVRRRRA